MHATPPDGAGVVAGVDGSDNSRAAAQLAAREATLRGLPLRLVHAFIWPLLHTPTGPSPYGPPEGGLRHDAERVLDEAGRDVSASWPQLEVATALVDGAAAPVLLHESRNAVLLVLGSRGLGGFAGLLLGSTGMAVTAHSHCPVVVVPDASSTGDRSGVVVGVDGSTGSAAALDFAGEEASLRGTSLLALQAEREQRGDQAPAGPVLGQGDRLRSRFPELSVTHRVVVDHPAKSLIAASKDAELLVVGSRGAGGFRGLLLGSVSQAVLRHARCPVAVVPRPAADSSGAG